MTKWLLLIPVTLALGGCAEIATAGGPMLAGGPAASNAALAASNPSPSPTPRRPARATAKATAVATPDREAELASLRKGSPEWWALHDAIEAEADASLTKRLIICNGCFSKDAGERISSTR
jgi:hypothetical protein